MALEPLAGGVGHAVHRVGGGERPLVVVVGVALAGVVGLEAGAVGGDVAEGVVDHGESAGLPRLLDALRGAVRAPLGEVADPLALQPRAVEGLGGGRGGGGGGQQCGDGGGGEHGGGTCGHT